MAEPDRALIATIRAALATAGDSERAAAQQAYMKSALPFHGVTAPALRTLLRPILDLRLPDRSTWTATAIALVDEAAHREEWYAAVQLTGHRQYRAWQDPDAVPLYEHLVAATGWWDVVDEVAANRIGPILRAHRDTETPRMQRWARHDDLWLRRTAILSQLTHRAETDTDLLTDVIEANLEGTTHGQSFWIRKAIGWALRQHARTDPAWVRGFLADHADTLAGLSRREAAKHL